MKELLVIHQGNTQKEIPSMGIISKGMVKRSHGRSRRMTDTQVKLLVVGAPQEQ
jgi:hypothetical protein